MAAFGVPALLALLLIRRLWPALVLLVHAPVSEVLQAALAQGRSGDPADVAADVVGVALGTGIALVLARRGRTRPPSRPGPGRGHLNLGAGSAYDPGVPSERSDVWGYSSVGRAFRSQ